jgi:hypothetical protein
MKPNSLPPYLYGAARAMVHLRGQYLQECYEVWQQAKAHNITLPESDHPGYESLNHLLRHAFSADRYYIKWMCEQIELLDPKIDSVPPPEEIEAQAAAYLTHLNDRWATPLADVDEERFNRPEYLASWGVRYCIDAMLEHAVMHPILHRVQLEELLVEQEKID